jgi:hypothetical protein
MKRQNTNRTPTTISRASSLPVGYVVTELFMNVKINLLIYLKEKIPYSQLNDDYCDCKDGSDEPGTSACLNSMFFCDIQNAYFNNYSIPSSRVNDNICKF